MKNVHQLLEEANRRHEEIEEVETALRTIKSRFQDLDTDDSSSESDFSDLDLSGHEPSPDQDNISEDDLDPEAEYARENSIPEPPPAGESGSTSQGLRALVRPGTPYARKRPQYQDIKPNKKTQLHTVNTETSKQAQRKTEKIQLQEERKEFAHFINGMLEELYKMRDEGPSQASSRSASSKKPDSVRKLPSGKDEEMFWELLQNLIVELDNIGFMTSPRMTAKNASIIASCARLLGIKRGVHVAQDQFKTMLEALKVHVAVYKGKSEVETSDAETSYAETSDAETSDAELSEVVSKVALRAEKAGFRSGTRTKTDRSPAKSKVGVLTLTADGQPHEAALKTKPGLLKWAAKYFGPSGENPEFVPPSDVTRDFTIKKEWTRADLQAETLGRHPYIDPEVKLVLLELKEDAQKAYEENEDYIWGCEYHPDDLQGITISTLPSNGKYKPAHRGPEDAIYYYGYTFRLFSSINTWIERYIVPTDKKTSININGRSVLPAIKRVFRALDYFNESDFVIPAGEKSLKKRNARRKMKRQMFFQYVFYHVLYENIWSQWLYGLRKDVEYHVLESAGLKKEQRNTKEGHFARGRWFTDNVRRKPTSMAQQVLEHQAQIATTLRQIFVPLLNAGSREPGSKRRMVQNAEKELYMIISDAQALQFMFQSEVDVHMIAYDRPGTRFEASWMINAASAAAMKPLGLKPVPGKRELSKWDRIDFAFQPALFIGEGTEIYEQVVVSQHLPL
ncbi:hypothetical protein TWF730_001161 [Orbilia blumenaviensis]|uniref:Uncharacterized protein n=1 Tax=Orbilia blumenaviensis TaxID=1796055 RepID=A0AAV9VQY0_9PEZI